MDADDEIGQLCQDFEEMRIRLKENAEDKIQYDKDNKELISNISHDLKTPNYGYQGICGRHTGRCGVFAGKAGQIHPYHIQ